MNPSPIEEIRRRYGTREAYLSRFEDASRAAADAGVILPRDVEPLTAEAPKRFP